MAGNLKSQLFSGVFYTALAKYSGVVISLVVAGVLARLLSPEDFGIVADLILKAVKSSSENDVTSPDGVEEFLDEAAIFDLEAKTEDRTDFSIAFWHSEAPLRGFNVRSRLSAMNPLLDGL